MMSLDRVLLNIEERDVNVSRKLFESNPMTLAQSTPETNICYKRSLIGMSNEMLMARLKQDMEGVAHTLDKFSKSYDALRYAIESDTTARKNIPAIQPINNKQLTLLAGLERSP